MYICVERLLTISCYKLRYNVVSLVFCISDDEGSLTPIDDYEDDSEAATWRSDEVSGADQSQTGKI